MNSHLRPLALAALLVAAHAFTGDAAAQERRATTVIKKLAVAIIDDAGHYGYPFSVSEDDADNRYAAETSPPARRVSGWKQPEGEPPLTRIRLRLTYEGDAVRIRVFAVLDDSWPPDAPGPKYGEREKSIGSYLAREGETVSVKELKGFGFEPLVLAVSEAKPEPEMPFIPAPARAESRLKSIEVVSFLTEGAEMESARLVVRNVSPKNIVGLEIGSDGSSNTAMSVGPRPLIASGGTYETTMNMGRGASETPRGLEPLPQPGALVVGAAVFEDGTYEGDAKTAAMMFARREGQLLQFKRVLKLLEDALGADEPDVPAALTRLKSQVGGLRIDVEPSALDELVSRFPDIPRDECRRHVAVWAVDGLKSARAEALSMLEGVERARSKETTATDIRDQLETVRATIEKHVGRARQ